MSVMGYRSHLLRSVLILTAFYGLVGIAAFYSMGPKTLEAWLVARGLWDPAEDGPITPFNAASAATSVVVGQAQLSLPWIVGGIAISFAGILLVVACLRLAHHRRGRGTGGFRGLSVSVSAMPAPSAPRTVHGLQVDGHGYKDKRYVDLLHSILGYLKAHEYAYCGEGHEQGLFAHTLNVINAALELDETERDPLLVLAAAAHDMGKSTAYRRVDGKWVRVAYHDKESARILASFEPWWALPMPDRSILLYAVKHEHSPSLLPTTLPGLRPADIQRMARLLEQLRQVDGRATAEEKEEVRENLSVDEVVVQAFLQSVATGPFQRRGLAKGIQALGWRDGSRLYVLERAMREYAMSQMSALHAAVLGGKHRDKGEVADFSKELLAALDKRGWLIKTAEIKPSEEAEPKPLTLPSHDTLWRLQSGTHVFNGVYIVELPESEQHIYPKQTLYELTLLGPLNIRRQEQKPSNASAAKAGTKTLKDRPPKKVAIERTAPKSPLVRERNKHARPDKPDGPVAPEDLPKEDIPQSEDAGEIKLFA